VKPHLPEEVTARFAITQEETSYTRLFASYRVGSLSRGTVNLSLHVWWMRQLSSGHQAPPTLFLTFGQHVPSLNYRPKVAIDTNLT
jgi:hypothetical protein